MAPTELASGFGAGGDELGSSLTAHLPSMHPMNSRFLAIFASLTFVAACQSGLGNGPLDGRVYSVTLAGGGQAPATDALIFDGGQFESTLCREHGFRLAPYESTNNGDATKFEVVAKSADAGANAWSGKIHGDTVEGTLKCTDPKGAVTEFKFNGVSASGLLDGKTFEGMVCEGESKSGDKDRLVFAHGAFDSNACRAYGFTMSPYTATKEGDATKFSAVATNSCGDSNRWDGTIRGDDISGTMQHMNASGKVEASYKFVAKLVK